jgi:LIM domain kinase 1
MYIHDKTKPFPWNLRLSFATDIARALAYLHARKCIHRDLKGENLLITANGRIKITDFGFARIAARNEDEYKRLTFCGTDSYMSPEILLGEEFDLPTDIFSLGIIFCEIAARHLADDNHFKRSAPSFTLDKDEVSRLAGPECPAAFLALCMDCLQSDPATRPGVREILERLRTIEAEVLARSSQDMQVHVGSVKFMEIGGKRPGVGPRIPSFGMGVGKEVRGPGGSVSDDSDDELMEAALGLSHDNDRRELRSAYSATRIQCFLSDDNYRQSTQPLLDTSLSTFSDYSTTVIRHPTNNVPSTCSILTIHPFPNRNDTLSTAAPLNSTSDIVSDSDIHLSTTDSMHSIESYHTAYSSSVVSTAAATEGSSTIRTLPLVHRFTLIKPGVKRSGTVSPTGARSGGNHAHSPSEQAGWNPIDLFFSSGLLVTRCDICNKRLGWKPVLECDDCGLRYGNPLLSYLWATHIPSQSSR